MGRMAQEIATNERSAPPLIYEGLLSKFNLTSYDKHLANTIKAVAGSYWNLAQEFPSQSNTELSKIPSLNEAQIASANPTLKNLKEVAEVAEVAPGLLCLNKDAVTKFLNANKITLPPPSGAAQCTGPAGAVASQVVPAVRADDYALVVSTDKDSARFITTDGHTRYVTREILTALTSRGVTFTEDPSSGSFNITSNSGSLDTNLLKEKIIECRVAMNNPDHNVAATCLNTAAATILNPSLPKPGAAR
jgi:hypothetical protein